VPSFSIRFPPLAFGAITGVVPSAARPYSEKVLLATNEPLLNEVKTILVIAEVVDQRPATS
jgi:hypothetical protein